MLRPTVFVPVLALIVAVGALHGDLGAKGVGGTALGAPRSLPAPTGPFQVGRVTISLTDPSRQERVPPGGGARALMVDVWYPAEGADAPAASYIERAAFSTPQSTEILKRYLGAAFGSVRAGLVRTHAVDAAVFARGAGPSPVLVFSHGGGEGREIYATQLEDLASHGYVVAAITHTFDSVLAVFPDGGHAPMVPDRWPYDWMRSRRVK